MPEPEKTKPGPEHTISLTAPGADFGAAYTAVASLQFSINQMPSEKLQSAVRTLSDVLTQQPHKQLRQSYFLHRKAANTLQDILLGSGLPGGIADEARQILVQCLSKSGTTALRAAAEALGSLPVSLPDSAPPQSGRKQLLPEISWSTLLDDIGEKTSGRIFRKGRSLILPLNDTGRILTIKTTAETEAQELLFAESMWMAHLAEKWPRLCDRPGLFTIPQPIKINDSYVFKINNLPDTKPASEGGDPVCFAAGYISVPDYFCYPNEYDPLRPLTNREILVMLSRSAFILGRLASSGIIHTAPIPLFHNRIQRHRRTDRGFYQWPRGGRLDRWLDSCRYPNIGKTGLRDFEHFIGFTGGSRKLYEYIGTHLLSLVLVAGSIFRNRDTVRVGLAPNGSPVDARDLFDPVLLKATINRIFYSYYQGFTHTRFAGKPPFDTNRLTQRLIDEMGVDRHMEEILRVAEQQFMSDREFIDFLLDRGFEPERAAAMKRGEKDITILTGPHLGAFNSRISLPELTEFVAVGAAVCIGGKFFQSSFL